MSCKNCKHITDVKKVEYAVNSKKDQLMGFCKLHKIVVHNYHLHTTKCDSFKEVKGETNNNN